VLFLLSTLNGCAGYSEPWMFWMPQGPAAEIEQRNREQKAQFSAHQAAAPDIVVKDILAYKALGAGDRVVLNVGLINCRGQRFPHHLG
jgi:hypothetical protein